MLADLDAQGLRLCYGCLDGASGCLGAMGARIFDNQALAVKGLGFRSSYAHEEASCLRRRGRVRLRPLLRLVMPTKRLRVFGDPFTSLARTFSD